MTPLHASPRRHSTPARIAPALALVLTVALGTSCRRERVAAIDTAGAARASRSSPLVLWVDDQPENNRPERNVLANYGVRFEISTSTADAVARASRQQFDAVVTDMRRPESDTAGYVLLAGLRAAGVAAPVVIYSASANPAYIEAARRRGAYGETNDAGRLVEMVLAATQGK